MPAAKAERTPLETYLTTLLREIPDGKCRSCGINAADVKARSTVCARCRQFRSYTKKTEGTARWPDIEEIADWLDDQTARDSRHGRQTPRGVEILTDPHVLAEIGTARSGGRKRCTDNGNDSSTEQRRMSTFSSLMPDRGIGREQYYAAIA
jgi:hypothetical protein